MALDEFNEKKKNEKMDVEPQRFRSKMGLPTLPIGVSSG